MVYLAMLHTDNISTIHYDHGQWKGVQGFGSNGVSKFPTYSGCSVTFRAATLLASRLPMAPSFICSAATLETTNNIVITILALVRNSTWCGVIVKHSISVRLGISLLFQGNVWNICWFHFSWHAGFLPDTGYFPGPILGFSTHVNLCCWWHSSP